MAHGALRAGAVAAAFVLAGCDLGRVQFEDQPPEVVLDQSLAAMDVIRTVTLSSRVTVGGVRFRFDAAIDRQGSCKGALSLGTMAGKADVLVVDGEGFVRGNRTFWLEVSEGEDTPRIKELTGRWVRPAPEAELMNLCDLDEILDRAELMVEDELGLETLTRMVLPEYEGYEVVQFQAYPFAARIATGADHFLLHISGIDDRLDFSRFNDPLSVEAPPEDEVLDFSGGGLTVT